MSESQSINIPDLENSNHQQYDSAEESFDNSEDAYYDCEPNKDELEDIKKEQIQKRKESEDQLSTDIKQEHREKAMGLKKLGNDLYLNKKYEEAIAKFNEALNICPLCFSEDQAIFYSNRAAAKSSLGNLDDAIEDCNKAIDLDSKYLKVILRRAKLYDKLDKCYEALKDYQRVLELDPNHRESYSRIMPLEMRIKEKMKAEMLSNLKNLGNMCLKPFGLSTDNFQCTQDANTGSYSVNFKK